jgi:2-keto-4-pentenoate hydratase/2-oxohepta-3-ene-1,7-dioic acid hydratase in catechol pathway
MDRRKVLSTGSAAAVAALAGCASPGTGGSAGGSARTVFAVPQPMLPIAARARCFRCGGSTASAATTQRTRARWAPTRTASRRSSSRSRATRSSSSPSARPPTIPYPPLTKNYHYEIELVAALGKGGRNVPAEQALDLVYGYTIGLDMTRRDLQRAMGDEKKPWEIGKSFDRSAPMGPLHRVADVGHFTKGAITLKVNGVTSSRAPTST